MTKSKQNKKGLIAGITAAILGVGAAVAGTVILKDKKNRDKVKKVLNNAKDKTENYVKKITKKSPPKKSKSANKKSK